MTVEISLIAKVWILLQTLELFHVAIYKIWTTWWVVAKPSLIINPKEEVDTNWLLNGVDFFIN